MKLREFHIWDFPEKKVRVLFKEHAKFVRGISKLFGSQKELSQYLGIPQTHISQWKRLQLYIPLEHINKIVKKLKLNWNELEKDIISYKGINTSSPIFKPKLPIKETPDIFALITHIICDGSVNKKGIPCYINSSKPLIENIKRILENSFGQVDMRIESGKGMNKNCYVCYFPKIITNLLEYFYNIKFYRGGKLPVEILKLPKKFSVAVIKAFADDEGTVDLNRRIGFYSTNKELLEVLIRLLQENLNFNQMINIFEKDKGYYYFYIKPKDIGEYEKEIGFNHPGKKERLKEIVKWQLLRNKPGIGGKTGETKEKLLKLLNNQILSTYDLMKELGINKSNINTQIKKLREIGLIVQEKKIGQTIFWTRRK